ncbi:MAG: hypothetical protein LBK13_11650, partial [Spirochaetales bacterium]|nr:hypothetical protein [Spirochaetales bacterium]
MRRDLPEACRITANRLLVFFAASLLASAIPLSAGEGPRETKLRERAARLAGSLDDRALAAQVLLTGIDGKGRIDSDMAELLSRIPAGGVMLFRYNLSVDKEEIAPFLRTVSDTVISGCGIAPLLAVDHEG